MNETQNLPTPLDVEKRRDYASMEYLACILLAIAFDSNTLSYYKEDEVENEIKRAKNYYAKPNESLKRLVRRLADLLKVQYD